MHAFGTRVDRPGGRRQAHRKSTQLVASATSLDGSRSVLIENLSADGARVVGRFLPAVGKEMLLRTEESLRFGRVAWARSDRRGISFED
jgi:hypothetical protein